MTALLTKLDVALEKLEEISDKLLEVLTSEEEKEQAREYMADAEKQHTETVSNVET